MKGKNLEFISRIRRDGLSVEVLQDREQKHLSETKFQMASLSITKGTHIASEFNSYVVKIKKQNQ